MNQYDWLFTTVGDGMANQETQSYDIAIAGGGLAGVLAAARLHEKHPDCSILLIDKNSALGGRLRGSDPASRRYSYGLQGITPELFHYWDQVLKQDPEAQALPAFMTHKMARGGILAANKVSEFPVNEMMAPKGARALAGLTASRDWKTVDESFEKVKRGDQAFSSIWGGTRKSPSALVLEHYSHVLGIPDLWEASAKAVLERSALCKDGFYFGNWEQALTEILNRPSLREKLTVKTNCRIADSKFNAGEWLIQTELGPMKASSLVVAQPPWEAVLWLPKSNCPEEIILMANKTKPVSVVVLSDVITKKVEEIPEMILVPAEEVQIIIHNQKEIVYQATLDYEITMQAPEVVKAVKRLKRAKKKLLAAYPELVTEGEHLSLLPVGWSQPVNHSDRRWADKLDDQKFQQERLVFCGDSYGSSCDGDKNVIASVTAASKTLALT